MNNRVSKLTPLELIVDIFIVTAIFAAMVAGFLIVIQSLNAGQNQLFSSSETYSQSPNTER